MELTDAVAEKEERRKKLLERINPMSVQAVQHILSYQGQHAERQLATNDYLGDTEDLFTSVSSSSILAHLSEATIAHLHDAWKQIGRIQLLGFYRLLREPLIGTGIFDAQGNYTEQKRKKKKIIVSGNEAEDVGGKSDLELYLTDLFHIMDIGRNNYLVWEQFITYIIETVFAHRLDKDAAAGEDGGSPVKTGKGATLTSVGHSVRVDSYAGSEQGGGSMLYRGDVELAQPVMRQHWLSRIQYFPSWDTVAVANHETAAVINAEHFDNVNKQGSKHIPIHYLKHEGAVIAMEYLHNLRVFITAAAEKNQLRFWNVHLRKDLKFLKHCTLDVNQQRLSTITTMRANERLVYSSDRVKLMIGTREGDFLTINLQESDMIKRNEVTKIPVASNCKLHDDAISDILVLPRSGKIVTCSMDGKIYTHLSHEDPLRSRSEYVGHKKGVYRLTYCSGYELFASCGFEYHALCWAENLPYSAPFKLIDVLAPHVHPLLDVISVPNTPQIYSIDVSGVAKLFDIRTFKVVGSWRAFDPNRVPPNVFNSVQGAGERGTTHLGNIGGVCYTGASHRNLLFGSKGIFKFHTENRNPDADRSHPLVEPLIVVTSSNKHICTATPHTIRLWALEDGKIAASYPAKRFSTAKLTTVAIDDISAKLVCGFADGAICACSMHNGSILHRYISHNAPIRQIIIDTLNGIIISSAITGEVFFWEDRDGISSGTKMNDHVRFIYGANRPIPQYYQRPLPSSWPEFISRLFERKLNKEIKEARLGHWAIRRWKRLLRRTVATDEVDLRTISVLEPNTKLYIKGGAKFLHCDPNYSSLMVTGTVARAEILQYDRSVTMTHRMYHGRHRKLNASAFCAKRNIACVTDVSGLMFLWLCLPLKPAVLLSAWRNRCLVAKYSLPSKDLVGVESDEEVEGHANNKTNEGDSDSEEDYILPDNEEKEKLVGESKKLAPVPQVCSLYIDPIRNCIISGDDVGFISVWEFDTVLLGVADWREALYGSRATGAEPRWVLSWRAHNQTVSTVALTEHSMYSIISSSPDNNVALWTVDGKWLASLRQGPIVVRTWPFPDYMAAWRALVRLRCKKIQFSIRSGSFRNMKASSGFGDVRTISPEVENKLRWLVTPSRQYGDRRSMKEVAAHIMFIPQEQSSAFEKEGEAHISSLRSKGLTKIRSMTKYGFNTFLQRKDSTMKMGSPFSRASILSDSDGFGSPKVSHVVAQTMDQRGTSPDRANSPVDEERAKSPLSKAFELIPPAKLPPDPNDIILAPTKRIQKLPQTFADIRQFTVMQDRQSKGLDIYGRLTYMKGPGVRERTRLRVSTTKLSDKGCNTVAKQHPKIDPIAQKQQNQLAIEHRMVVSGSLSLGGVDSSEVSVVATAPLQTVTPLPTRGSTPNPNQHHSFATRTQTPMEQQKFLPSFSTGYSSSIVSSPVRNIGSKPSTPALTTFNSQGRNANLRRHKNVLTATVSAALSDDADPKLSDYVRLTTTPRSRSVGGKAPLFPKVHVRPPTPLSSWEMHQQSGGNELSLRGSNQPAKK